MYSDEIEVRDAEGSERDETVNDATISINIPDRRYGTWEQTFCTFDDLLDLRAAIDKYLFRKVQR